MYRIAICDDNSKHIEEIVNQIRKQPDFSSAVIYKFSTYHKFFNALKTERYCFDMVIMDIDLGANSGITLAQQVNIRLPHCPVIFVTGYLHLAPDAYLADHTYLVHKLSLEERLPLALKKAEEKIRQQNNAILVINKQGNRLVILQADIMYIERRLRKSYIITEESNWESYDDFDVLMEQLNPEVFFQCHKSYIVNLEKVTKYTLQQFSMNKGKVVPISRRYYEMAKDEFLKYIGQKE